jgi:hypothetical protein
VRPGFDRGVLVLSLSFLASFLEPSRRRAAFSFS